jgi:hypothetical protein
MKPAISMSRVAASSGGQHITAARRPQAEPATYVRLEYSAPEHVRDVIAALGRTEAVKFSPNNRRLAVASFLRNKIAIFEICIVASPNGRKISITDVAEISSTYLKEPHGIDFFDDEKIIVVNRLGDATIFRLPSGGGSYELVPLEVIPSGAVLHSPGAVSITKKGQDVCEVLICSNFRNMITKHLIDFREGCSVKGSKILLKKRLDLPDGVSISEPWIAISNHDSHSVLLYENTGSLNEHSEPDGILRCVRYPHGLQFTSDGRFILVADAGAPYVHIFMNDGLGWRGVRSPVKSFRVLNDEDFLRGRNNVHEGGPKGIDIDNSMSTFVTTCHVQPLAFFDLAGILEGICLLQRIGAHSSPDVRETLNAAYEKHCQDQRALEIKYELETQSNHANHAAAVLNDALAVLMNSKSWRYTAPLRRVYSLLTGRRAV